MYYINELKTEGVTTAPRWVQPDNVESESGLKNHCLNCLFVCLLNLRLFVCVSVSL